MEVSSNSVMSLTDENSRIEPHKFGSPVRRQRSHMPRGRGMAWANVRVIPASKHEQPMKGSLLVCKYCSAKYPCVETLSRHKVRCLALIRKIARNKYGKPESSEEECEDNENGPFWWSDGEIFGSSARYYAESAMEFLNELDNGKKYELVAPGPFAAAGISHGPIVHANLLAKARDCPGAQVETFFTQIRMHRARVVDLCVSLGPSHELPFWTRANLHGCHYCLGTIHHPAPASCEKLILGGSGEIASWLQAEWNGERGR